MRQTLLAATLVLAMAACSGDDAAQDASSDASTADAAAAEGTPGASADTAAAAASAKAAASNAKRTPVFTQTFTHKRQSYALEVASGVTRSTVTITPKGLTLSNKPVKKEMDGLFTRAEMADLDADGEPEIYVFMKSAETGDKASAFAAASDQGRRIVEVPVPDLAADAKNSTGYRGSDEFAIVEKVLARRFPLHDASGEPTGTMRQMQYKLVKGVNGPEFKLEHVAEF